MAGLWQFFLSSVSFGRLRSYGGSHMIRTRRVPEGSVLRYFHEALFSFNVAFVTMTIVLEHSTYLAAGFSQMESSLNGLLGIRQTDYIRGYFAILIPSMLLGSVLWAVLRASERRRLSQQILRSAAGFFALFALPAFWIYAFQRYGWPFGWPYRGGPFELIAVLFCAFLFKSGRWRLPWWSVSVLLAGHYIFLWLCIGGNYAMPNYAGPIAPILSLCSGLAWALYIRRLPPQATIHGALEKEPLRI
jgi:hypothetical protein